MLDLDKIYYINGLQFHGDFQDTSRFYFFPGAPRIHREDGKPAFKLMKYKDVADNNPLVGGAFLMFTVDIGVDQQVLDDAKQQLRALAGREVTLAPVQFHTGTVRLLALGATPETLDQQPQAPTNRFIQQIYGTTKPSLYGENLAVFGLHLDEKGATLLEKSFRRGGGLLGVVYDLTYTGIRPALEVKAKVDFKRVYSHLWGQLKFQYAMIGAELEAQLEWLREQRAIEIEITRYDTDPATVKELEQQAMDLIKQEVIAKMLQPSLQVPQQSTNSQGNLLDQVIRNAQQLSKPPSGGAAPAGPAPAPAARTSEGDAGPTVMDKSAGTPAAGAQSGGGSGAAPGFALTFSLKFLRQEEQKTAEFDFRVNQAVDRSAAPQGSLRLLLDGLNMDDYIEEENLWDPFYQELGAKIGVTGNWEVLGIERVVVNATYQPDPAGPIVLTAGWNFDAPNGDPQPFNVSLDKNNPVRLYEYTTQVFLKDLDYIDSKTRNLVKKDKTADQVKLINPANEFVPLLVTVEAGPLDWETVPRVDVTLLYEDTDNHFAAKQLFTFKQDQLGPYRWVVYPVDHKERRNYKATFIYYIKDSYGNVHPIDPVSTEYADEAIVVPPPFRGRRTVRLIPAVDRDEVQLVEAELLFEKNRYRFSEQLSFDAGNLGAQTVTIPVPDPDPKHDKYSVNWSILYKNNDIHEVGWTDFQGPIAMLDDGIHSVQTVDIELKRSPQADGLESIVFTLESLAPDDTVVDTDEVIVRDEQTACSMDLMLKKGTPLRYRYTLTKVKADGEEILGPFESTRTKLIL